MKHGGVVLVGEGALRKVLFSTRKEGFDKWAMACSRREYCELPINVPESESDSIQVPVRMFFRALESKTQRDFWLWFDQK